MGALMGRIAIDDIPTKAIPVATDGILIHNQSHGTRLLTVETLAGIASDAVDAPVIDSVVINGVPYEGAVLSATVTLSAGSEGAYYAYDWYIDDVLTAQTELFTVPTGTLGKEIKVVATVVNSLGTDDDEDVAYVFRRLITEDGYIDPQFTVTRAGVAHAFNANGELVEYPANTMVPRYDPVTGDFLGPLVCEQRTNYAGNPRAVGVTVGGSGTGWNGTGAAGGITREIVGVGTEFGMNYVDYRVYGTSTAMTGIAIFGNINVAATLGQTWTSSFYARIVAGSKTGFSAFRVAVHEVNAGGSSLANTASPFNTNLLTDDIKRLTVSRVLSDGGMAFVRMGGDIVWNDAQTLDITVRIYCPQLELAPVASDPILPPVGTIAASTRNASNPFMLNQNFGIGEGTILTDMRGDVTGIVGSSVRGMPVSFQRNESGASQNYYAYSITGTGDANAGKFRTFFSGTGTGNAMASTANISALTFKKSAARIKSGESALSVVGVATVTSTGTTVPEATVNHVTLGMRKDGQNAFPYPEIRALYHTPVGATNTYLEAYAES
jgi:hypothetical protein